MPVTIARPLARLALPLAALGLAVPALADQPPSPADRERIETVLRGAGFTTWEEIEMDDGMWEVDDAVATSGRIYDLKIDPRSWRIVRRVRD